MAISTKKLSVLDSAPLETVTSSYTGVISSLNAIAYTSRQGSAAGVQPTRYLFYFEFNGGNNDRSQITVNGAQIFDSYLTGVGTNRVTSGWGVVLSTVTTSREYFRVVGTGTGRISSGLKYQFVALP